MKGLVIPGSLVWEPVRGCLVCPHTEPRETESWLGASLPLSTQTECWWGLDNQATFYWIFG